MARIPTLTLETMNAEQQEIYRGVMARRGPVQGPLLAAMHRPQLGVTMGHFGDAVRAQASIPRVLTAIAVMQTTRFMNCEYMWAIHKPLSVKEGLRADILESIRRGETPANLDDDQRRIWQFCTELLQTKRLSDATHAAVKERWGVTACVDLSAMIGYYTLCALMIGANDLDLPPGHVPELAPL